MDTLESQAELVGKLTGATRRSFIRGIAAAGASTAAAYALDRGGPPLDRPRPDLHEPPLREALERAVAGNSDATPPRSSA